MDLSELISLCTLYNNLGWAVQEQLDSVMQGEDLNDQNNNALEMIRDFLGDVLETGIHSGNHSLINDVEEIIDDITTHLESE